MDAVLLGLAPTRIALLPLLLLLSLPACPQEREGLRQQVRSVEDKCREFQEALQCKICRAVSAACAVFRERDMGGWVGLPQLHGLPCLWRCGMIHPPAPLICLPCLLCARPSTPPPACPPPAGPAQLRGAALPALSVLRHLLQAALRRQPQLPRLQLRRHRLPDAHDAQMTAAAWRHRAALRCSVDACRPLALARAAATALAPRPGSSSRFNYTTEPLPNTMIDSQHLVCLVPLLLKGAHTAQHIGGQCALPLSPPTASTVGG